MFNTFKNINRNKDRYGNLYFISFLGAVLSRLAYLDDNDFLNNYSSIMGPIILPPILAGINNVKNNELDKLLDDQTIFKLNEQNELSKYTYTYNNKKFVDFVSLNMPQNINIINGEMKGNISYIIQGNQPQTTDIKYISIAWSNYGEIYIVADKRMPNTIFLIFRGTYSAKTAALYSKPTSATALEICKNYNEKFLYGIFKATVELINTIMESLRYLAVDFLQATQPESVKIFTTGHSLGGAMCTNFAYIWLNYRNNIPYNDDKYNVLSKNIICISLGAPRSMGPIAATNFCEFVKNKKILFLRITTRGDPIPGLPLKTLGASFGFQHPCSQDDNARKYISIDCNDSLKTTSQGLIVDYNKDLDCQNYKTRAYVPNQLSHTIYIYIKYLNAVDIINFIKGVGTQMEIKRGSQGETYCRLIMGTLREYKVIFFNVEQIREKSNITEKKIIPEFGGQVKQDTKMTYQLFNNLINQMKQIEPSMNKSPKFGYTHDIDNIEGNLKPNLCDLLLKKGGKSRKNYKYKKIYNKKSNKKLKKYNKSKKKSK